MANYFGFSALLIVGSAAQPAMADVQAGSVDLFAQSVANADAQLAYDYEDVIGGASNTPINASEAFSAADVGGTPTVTLASSMNDNHAFAILADAAHGSVKFTGSSTASVTAAGISADPGASASAYGLDAFSYLFTVTTPAKLTVIYSTEDNGQVSSVPGIDLLASVSTNDQFGFLPTNGQGTAVFDFNPGDYTLEIFSDAFSQNAVQSGAAGMATASSDEQFSYVISGVVPEPATWAMMLTGFGAIGLASRMRVRANLRTA